MGKRENLVKLNTVRPRTKRYRRPYMLGHDLHDVEELPLRESMGARWWSSRWCDDDWNNPFDNRMFKRFLRANVGRPWNDVFADICRRLAGANSKLSADFRADLKYHVQLNVRIVDGVMYGRYGFKVQDDFYVHPETGLLLEDVGQPRYRPGKNRRKHNGKFEQLDINKLEKYVRIDGSWFHVEFEPFGEHGGYDVILRDIFPHSSEGAYGLNRARRALTATWGAPILAVKKRQANRHEIKHIIEPGLAALTS